MTPTTDPARCYRCQAHADTALVAVRDHGQQTLREVPKLWPHDMTVQCRTVRVWLCQLCLMRVLQQEKAGKTA